LPYRITLAVEGRPEAFDQYKPRRSEEMNMHIRDYVEKRKAELDEFEKDWYAQMEAKPDSYTFDTTEYWEWMDQEEAFVEMRREEG
jgi:hypothetical protein